MPAYTDGVPDPVANGAGIPTNLAARGPGEYYANVAHMDYQAGRILARLDALGLRENTVVVFTSDNGPVTRDWRHWYEINLYGSTGDFSGRKARPLRRRHPGAGHRPLARATCRPGPVSDGPACGYDLLPTIAAVVGLKVPSDRAIDGEDASGLLTGRAVQRQRPIYWEFDDDQGFHYALRDGRWKLLADKGLTKVALYDLVADHFEVVDRAATERAVVERLLAAMKARATDVASDPLRPRR